jgi:hypothetical protein
VQGAPKGQAQPTIGVGGLSTLLLPQHMFRAAPSQAQGQRVHGTQH